MRPALSIFTLALFLAASACVWMPLTTHSVVFDPGLGKNRPAGQIVRGYSISEVVHPPQKSANISDESVNCIALRFATYMRRNEGSLRVIWRQENRGHQWTVDTSRLEDNSFVDLCLDKPMDARKPFALEVLGLDGKPGSSATVWLTSSSGASVNVNGKELHGFGLALRLSKEERLTARDLFRLNGGAFAAGFLLSLLIGVLALVSFSNQGMNGSPSSPGAAS